MDTRPTFKFYICLLVMIQCLGMAAQTDEPNESPVDLRGKFDKMLKESNRYQDFKVVKQVRLNAFIKEVGDTLASHHQAMAREMKAMSNLREQLSESQTTQANLEEQVVQLQAEKDGISALGMQMDKGAFTGLMYAIIAGLAILGALLFVRLRAAMSSQQQSKANAKNLEDDLASTKKRALEKEQELKREMQDYINQLEALKPPR